MCCWYGCILLKKMHDVCMYILCRYVFKDLSTLYLFVCPCHICGMCAVWMDWGICVYITLHACICMVNVCMFGFGFLYVSWVYVWFTCSWRLVHYWLSFNLRISIQHVCMYVCMHACMHVHRLLCLLVCVTVYVYVSMYLCKYVNV